MLKSLPFLKIINVLLRIGSIGSKFLIITLMSKYFSVDVFGNYGLLTSFITILIFVLGLDFYNFSIRDIIKTDLPQDVVNKVSSTMLLYAVTYLFFVIIALLFFKQIDFVNPFLYYVIFLGITEHLSQEIYRLLIGFQKVLFANVMLAIRTLGWSLVVVFYYYTDVEITINKIFKLWLLSNVFTLFIVFLYTLVKNYNNLLKLKLDLSWVRQGLRISVYFLLATISLKLIEYANRFIVDYFMGEKLAGIFLFYSNISILITVYINTIVISFELPELIAKSNTPEIFSLLKKFKKSLFKHIIISSLFILVIIKPLLIWQNKEEFEGYVWLLFFLIVGVALMNYSLLYHFKLYIYHKDKLLLKIMLIASAVSLLITIVLTYFYGILGTSFAFLISAIVLYYLRYNQAKKLTI